MAGTIFSGLQSELADIQTVKRIGRVMAIHDTLIEISGLSNIATFGDRVVIEGADGPLAAEVLKISDSRLTVLSEGPAEGIGIGAVATLSGRAEISPDDSWIGRIIDPSGRALDGRPLFRGPHKRPLRAPPPAAAARKLTGERLETGMRVFNTLLPIVRGQRVGLFAGSGVGKSSLLAQLATGMAADVVVFALIGERGRELRAFTEKTLGPRGMARCVVIAATSDQPPQLRRRCAWTAMAVAEHFRDQGKHVLLIADSITRFAEAHREIALAAGEPASYGGYPPSMAHAVMALAERAGPGPEGSGDITAIFSVLVAGSDMEGPVADVLRGTLDGHVVLDRKIAERGRYPAVDLLTSVSRSLPDAASEAENRLIAATRKLLGAWDRAELMIQAGLYVTGSDPLVDQAIKAWPDLDALIAESEPVDIEASFKHLAACLPDQLAGG